MGRMFGDTSSVAFRQGRDLGIDELLTSSEVLQR
jgi:hypothetical protein